MPRRANLTQEMIKEVLARLADDPSLRFQDVANEEVSIGAIQGFFTRPSNRVKAARAELTLVQQESLARRRRANLGRRSAPVPGSGVMTFEATQTAPGSAVMAAQASASPPAGAPDSRMSIEALLAPSPEPQPRSDTSTTDRTATPAHASWATRHPGDGTATYAAGPAVTGEEARAQPAGTTPPGGSATTPPPPGYGQNQGQGPQGQRR